MPHIVRVRSDLTWKEALTEAQLRESMTQRCPRVTTALAPSGQKRRREAVDGVMLAGSDTAVTRNIFRGGRFVLSLLRGRETEARVLAGDLLPEPTDVLGSIRKLILSTGGVVVAQATSSSDLLLSVGSGEPTLSEKNCIIEGKYDIATLSWTFECVRRGVMLQRRYFDHVHRSARTEARLRQGRNGYLRFGLPRRDVVDVATLGSVYAEVGRQCDETVRSLVGADVAAEWPDAFAASQLPGWCVFEHCYAYFDWFRTGFTGPGPRVREPGTDRGLLAAGYAFAAAGGTRLDQLTTAATHVVVADEERAAAAAARLQAIGSCALVVWPAWVESEVGDL
jgi:hypothetical protein